MCSTVCWFKLSSMVAGWRRRGRTRRELCCVPHLGCVEKNRPRVTRVQTQSQRLPAWATHWVPAPHMKTCHKCWSSKPCWPCLGPAGMPAQLTDVLACCAISFKLLSSACMLWQVTTVMLSSTAFISCVPRSSNYTTSRDADAALAYAETAWSQPRTVCQGQHYHHLLLLRHATTHGNHHLAICGART